MSTKRKPEGTPVGPISKDPVETLFQEWLVTKAQIKECRAKLDLLMPIERELRLKVLVSDEPTEGMLTRRQVEVLAMVRQGKENKEIAWDLHISERTVKFHVSAILHKFHRQRRYDL